MRLILFFALLLLLSSDLTAQKLPENNSRNPAVTDLQLGQSYLKKSRTHKIIRFSLLGAGFGALAGVVILEASGNYYDSDYYDAEAAVVGIGLSMMATSIPFFIIGAKNKGRAEVQACLKVCVVLALLFIWRADDHNRCFKTGI